MLRLAQVLDEVLTGRRVVSNAATFRLLRRLAPEKIDELNKLEAEAVARKATQNDGPLNEGKAESRLTRDDLAAILGRQRTATVEEIEWLIAHATDHDLQLSTVEELQLRNLAARKLADRHLVETRDINRGAGTSRTEYRELTHDEVTRLEAIRVHAVRAIQGCQDHQRKRCTCWADARTQLFDLRRSAGEKSPVGMAALDVWNSVEALAHSYEKPASLPEPPLPVRTDIPGSEGMTPFNWRYHKTPIAS